MIMATTHKHSVPAIILLLVCAIHSASLVEATVIASATNQEDGGVIPQDDDGGLNPIGDTAQDIAGVFEPVDSDDSDSSATPGVSDGHSQKEPDLAEETIFYTTQSNHSNSGSASNGSTPLHTPPTHFKIAAHIQSNLHTGYSYFLPTDQLSSSFAHLPFLECGAVGSTTEGVPLVSGFFRHVPKVVTVPKERDVDFGVDVNNLETETKGVKIQGVNLAKGEDTSDQSDAHNFDHDKKFETDEIGGDDDISNQINQQQQDEDRPHRPAPPRYVVALSPLEITVGGNGNETQKFSPGDVIFVEDTWWGVWNEFDNEGESQGFGGEDKQNENEGITTSEIGGSISKKNNVESRAKNQDRMKGYIMQAASESKSDLNVLMLTVPPAIHRHWKNIQRVMDLAKHEKEEVKLNSSPQKAKSQNTLQSNNDGSKIRQPWWKLPTRLLHKHDTSAHANTMLPPPCSLESDPAFSHPSASSTSLVQHFNQHFTQLLKRVIHTHPHPSFLPHQHQDLLLPVLAQTAAATAGAATAFALVIQLSRMVSVGTAVGVGGACLVGLGTWGIVWLGEEIFDELELWKERRRLERRMSEGWGRGSIGVSNSGTSGRKRKMMGEDTGEDIE